MSSFQLIFSVVVFLSATGVAMVLLLQFAPSRAKQRLDSLAEVPGAAAPQVQWTKTAVNFAGKFAKLSLPSAGWETSPLRRRFLYAGYRGDAPALLYFGAKTLLAALLPAVAYAYCVARGTNVGTTNSVLSLVLLTAAAVGYYLPNIVLARLVFVRQREIFESFPDAADLLMVCVEAGLGLDAALVRVSEEMRLKSEALAEELHLVNLELRAGSSREKALRNFALRAGVEEVNTFATMLIQADRFGTSIGDSLRVFSDELRTKRRMRAEEVAAKIPLKLMFPLALCIFPALLLVLLGPAFIQVYRILLPTMAGGH